MGNNSHSFVHTNLHVFYHIAHDAYVAMGKNLNSRRKPRLDNEPGWIITPDPEQKSFKNALIAIVFCGIFLESLLHLLIVKHKGLGIFEKYDRKPYEDKLQLLGCDDHSILEGCRHYQEARREIVHEKAHIYNKNIRVAQKEAASAMELIQKIVTYFNLEMG
jgi:hypothetical protein